jgi:phosphoenolpyruvate-protein phosphotransferase (PTS system enzyme I)
MRDETKTSRMILGEVASSGLARGPAFVCDCTDESAVTRRTIGADETAKELQRFDTAIVSTEQELLRLQQEVEKTIGKREGAIFEAQILLLRDPSLREQVSARVLTENINIEAAVDTAFEKLVSAFMRLEDALFRERAADLKEIRKRILDTLTNKQPTAVPVLAEGGILVAGQLLSSVMAQLDDRTVRGLILEKGGQTAHATILARARGIPLLIHVADATKKIRSGDQLIVDGLAGRVFINPSPAIVHEYDQLEAQLHARRSALNSLIELPAVTSDGVSIQLSANIGKSADAVMAASLNAEGVGLYRTEFVFLVQNQFPSEEEQYQVYRATAEHLKPREVVIRVLDIGSDKLLPYFPFPVEANPSLGRRGTRLLLAHPEVLRTQLRAMLRLSATHPISILFPMIGGVEDMLAAKAAVESAKTSLRADGKAFDPSVAIGAMIETPAAAIMTERLAADADFFSVGTNDLVQYLLTTDRTSSEVASYYEPLHPAVLRALALVANAAKAKAKAISICGEMAGNPAFTRLLLGLGFRSLSVNPGEMLEVKNAIRATSLVEAEELAGQILRLGTIQEIKDCLRAAAYKESQKGVSDHSNKTSA